MSDPIVPRGDRTPQDIPDITLAEFMRARLDEDERVARAATPGTWSAAESYPDAWVIDGPTHNIANENSRGDISRGDAMHIARHDPARVLREVEAKRLIVAGIDPEDPPDLVAVLRLLALPYVDHPDYRDEWRPRT